MRGQTVLGLKIMAVVVLGLGLVWVVGMAIMRRQDDSLVTRRSYARDSESPGRSEQ